MLHTQLDTSQTELYEKYLSDLEKSRFGDRAALEDPKLPYRCLSVAMWHSGEKGQGSVTCRTLMPGQKTSEH